MCTKGVLQAKNEWSGLFRQNQSLKIWKEVELLHLSGGFLRSSYKLERGNIGDEARQHAIRGEQKAAKRAAEKREGTRVAEAAGGQRTVKTVERVIIVKEMKWQKVAKSQSNNDNNDDAEKV